MAMGVPALSVRQGQPADELRQLSIVPGPDDQMPVIAHHAVSQEPRLRPFDRLGQDGFEGLVIGVFLENRHSRVGAVQDVINVTACGCSLWTSHAARLQNQRSLVNNRFLTPFTVLTPSWPFTVHQLGMWYYRRQRR